MRRVRCVHLFPSLVICLPYYGIQWQTLTTHIQLKIVSTAKTTICNLPSVALESWTVVCKPNYLSPLNYLDMRAHSYLSLSWDAPNGGHTGKHKNSNDLFLLTSNTTHVCRMPSHNEYKTAYNITFENAVIYVRTCWKYVNNWVSDHIRNDTQKSLAKGILYWLTLSAYSVYAENLLSAYSVYADKCLSAYTLYADK